MRSAKFHRNVPLPALARKSGEATLKRKHVHISHCNTVCGTANASQQQFRGHHVDPKQEPAIRNCFEQSRNESTKKTILVSGFHSGDPNLGKLDRGQKS